MEIPKNTQLEMQKKFEEKMTKVFRAVMTIFSDEQFTVLECRQILDNINQFLNAQFGSLNLNWLENASSLKKENIEIKKVEGKG